METIAQFAAACETLFSDEIYDLFESASQQLRDTIYSWSEANSPEPVRSALYEIGVAYNIQSLKDY